jgi:hypothetical protein
LKSRGAQGQPCCTPDHRNTRCVKAINEVLSCGGGVQEGVPCTAGWEQRRRRACGDSAMRPPSAPPHLGALVAKAAGRRSSGSWVLEIYVEIRYFAAYVLFETLLRYAPRANRVPGPRVAASGATICAAFGVALCRAALGARARPRRRPRDVLHRPGAVSGDVAGKRAVAGGV